MLFPPVFPKDSSPFPYAWKLSDLLLPKKAAPTVFSTFCGAGGSTLGYKLAGFRSLGGNDLDKKQSKLYRHNLKPEWFYEGFISDVIKQPDIPKSRFSLDVLDGSPPCSLFSTAGLRERGWGKEKHFREGQAAQTLDLLFWDLIDLSAELKPKVVIAENVTGMLKGNAREYVQAITRDFKKAGYVGRWYLMWGQKVGLPQRRGRVFFIGLRNDLLKLVPSLRLNLNVNASLVPFSAIDTKSKKGTPISPAARLLWEEMVKRNMYESFGQVHPTEAFFNNKRTDPNKPVSTIPATQVLAHPTFPRWLNIPELLAASSWPTDYDWLENNLRSSHVCYGVGMSVPPVMCATVARAVKNQWLSHLN